jgi:polyisoprenoid-binding protein YceI
MTMKTIGVRTGAAALVALVLLASQAVAAPAAKWAVDPANSRVSFKGAMNGDAFTGVFKRWTADIAFDPKNLAGSKAAVAIDVGSGVTGDADRDQALPTADWFSAAHFPKATFVTSSIKNTGGDHYLAQGTLSIRGASRPVSLPFTLDIAGDVAKMNGALTLDRTAFGVGQGQWANGQVVDTKVTVDVAVTAHRVH